MDLKTSIQNHFGRAAPYYDGCSDWHRNCADRLVSMIVSNPFKSSSTILELGSGTGYLGLKLAQSFENPHDCRWIITDFSEPMLKVAQKKWQNIYPDLAQFMVCDIDQPTLHRGIDLIITSMALQWIKHPGNALEKLKSIMNPGGKIVWCTLVERSFSRWQEVCRDCGLRDGIQPLFPRDQLASWGMVESRVDQKFFLSGFDFARWLRGLGAHAPRSSYVPLSPAEFKRVNYAWDQQQNDKKMMDLHVAYGILDV